MGSFRRITPSQLFLLALVASLGSAQPSFSRVLSLEIEHRTPILLTASGELTASDDTSGDPDADTIAYELIEGRVHFGFDPTSPANALITDIHLAPLNQEGLIEAIADFTALQPIRPEDRRGTALIEAPNRGRRLALRNFNRLQQGFLSDATLDPKDPTNWGDAFLMKRGLTVLSVGWQADAPMFPGAQRLEVPRARNPNKTDGVVRGVARSDWVVDTPSKQLPLAVHQHTAHLAIASESPVHRLTRRRGREAEREFVDPLSWHFVTSRDAIEATSGDFEAGWIYELIYQSEAPPIMGLGFAAFRDFAAFAETNPDCPFLVEKSIATGVSQSGRFLRDFLYQGFNTDEAGRVVFDGMMILIGGAGRGGLNHRFSHPGRVSNPYANFFYPGDDFPFTGVDLPHPSKTHDELPNTHDRGDLLRAGLFDRARANSSLPKIFQINTGYEYWGRGASLIHMTPDGTEDVAPHSSERLFHIASAPHYSLPFPPAPQSEVLPGLFLGSSVDTSFITRALLERLLAWVERDIDPPPSSIPTLEAKTLVLPASLKYPVAGLKPPRSPHVAYRMDYGPGWPRGIVSQPPSVGAPYAIRVPAIDALGSERSGIRPLELQVPIGTYTSWALRYGKPGGGDEMTGYIGSFLPLAKNPASKKTGDDRPDFMTLYPNLDTYETRLTKAIDEMTDAGWLLPEDRRLAFQAGAARWEWAQSRPSPEHTR